MREKLIEILRQPIFPHELVDPVEAVADYLLDSGVIVPPCKIGDDIWWIDEDADTVKCEKRGVKGIVFTKDGFLIRDRFGCTDPIGTTYCFLSKEAAEAELKRRLEAGNL